MTHVAPDVQPTHLCVVHGAALGLEVQGDVLGSHLTRVVQGEVTKLLASKRKRDGTTRPVRLPHCRYRRGGGSGVACACVSASHVPRTSVVRALVSAPDPTSTLATSSVLCRPARCSGVSPT